MDTEVESCESRMTQELKWRKGMPVPVLCPVCNRVNIAKSFPLLINTVRKIWELSMQAYAPEMKLAVRETMGEMAVRNSPGRLLRILKEEGFITMFCMPCMAKTSEQMYREAGLEVVRIGNFIIDLKFWNSLDEKTQEEHARHALEASSNF